MSPCHFLLAYLCRPHWLDCPVMTFLVPVLGWSFWFGCLFPWGFLMCPSSGDVVGLPSVFQGTGWLFCISFAFAVVAGDCDVSCLLCPSLAILVPILSFCQGLLSFGSPWGVMFCGGCVLIDTLWAWAQWHCRRGRTFGCYLSLGPMVPFTFSLVLLQDLVVLGALGGAEIEFLPLVLSLSPSSLTSLGLSWAHWVCQVDWLCCEVLPPDFSFVLTDVDGCI